jgi:hypothetical protein
VTVSVANLPRVVYAAASSPTMTVVAVPAPTAPAVPGDPDVLVVNDCTTLAAVTSGNAIFSATTAQLLVNATVALGTTSHGTVVSSLPAGVAVTIT